MTVFSIHDKNKTSILKILNQVKIVKTKKCSHLSRLVQLKNPFPQVLRSSSLGLMQQTALFLPEHLAAQVHLAVLGPPDLLQVPKNPQDPSLLEPPVSMQSRMCQKKKEKKKQCRKIKAKKCKIYVLQIKALVHHTNTLSGSYKVLKSVTTYSVLICLFLKKSGFSSLVNENYVQIITPIIQIWEKNTKILESKFLEESLYIS